MTEGPNFNRFRNWEGKVIQIKLLPKKIMKENVNLEKEIEIPSEIREYWKDTVAAGRAYVAVHSKGTIQFCALTTNNEAARETLMKQLKEKGYYGSNKSWKYYPIVENQKEKGKKKEEKKIKVTVEKSPSGTKIAVCQT